MSNLMKMMQEKKRKAQLEARAASTPAPVPETIIDPITDNAEVLAVADAILPFVPDEPANPMDSPTPATNFKRAPSKFSAGLAEISTQLTAELSEADQKVQAQRDAGVYSLPESAQTLMGADADALIDTMQELDHALVAKTPEIRTLSRAIRSNLEQYPELVHILTDQQLHIMVQGYLIVANVKTAPKTKAAKAKAAGKKADNAIKAAASQSLEDLF